LSRAERPGAVHEVEAGTVISRSPSVPTVPWDDGMVLMNVEQGRYVGLDGVGRSIWEHLAEPCSVTELVDRLVAGFEGPRDAIEADLRTWLLEMAEMGIVRLT
jgi:coenzyme PQQ synthesis protein D (PqqD)